MDLRKPTSPHLPYRTVSARAASAPRAVLIRAQLFTLLPAAPYHRATWLWTSAFMVHCIHLYMQLGCWAWDDIIQVSAQPVTPSEGTTLSTGFPSASSRLRLMGHAVPATSEPSEKPSISSVYSDQYLLISGFCCFSRSTAAFSWRSEEHTSELQSRLHLVCRLLLEKKKNKDHVTHQHWYIVTILAERIFTPAL